MIPENTKVGLLTVMHSTEIMLVTVLKPGLLLPEVVYRIDYDKLCEAVEKQEEAIAWARAHC